MKPFNLEEAKKKGVKSLVYRNGERPLEVFFSEKAKNIVITVDSDGDVLTYEDDGQWEIRSGIDDGEWDLFMVEEEMWVNVYRNGDDVFCTNPCDSKEQAIRQRSPAFECIGTHKLIKE